jgi:hypothetical protein
MPMPPLIGTTGTTGLAFDRKFTRILNLAGRLSPRLKMGVRGRHAKRD